MSTASRKYCLWSASRNCWWAFTRSVCNELNWRIKPSRIVFNYTIIKGWTAAAPVSQCITCGGWNGVKDETAVSFIGPCFSWYSPRQIHPYQFPSHCQLTHCFLTFSRLPQSSARSRARSKFSRTRFSCICASDMSSSRCSHQNQE